MFLWKSSTTRKISKDMSALRTFESRREGVKGYGEGNLRAGRVTGANIATLNWEVLGQPHSGGYI